jgi:hypothetical protein
VSDISLEYFGNGIDALSASARNLPPSNAKRTGSPLALFVRVRNSLLPMDYSLRSLFRDQLTPEEMEQARQANIDPVMLTEKARMVLYALQETGRDLHKIAFKHGAGPYLYYRFLKVPVLNRVIDGMQDTLAVLAAAQGEDGEYVPGDELLRRLG